VRDEVDHQRHALEAVGVAESVLQVVGPVTDEETTVVHLDRDPGRVLSDLRRVIEA
jgi:hypothetical protein